MDKKKLGIVLSIFLGVVGLLGFLTCNTPDEKNEFGKGFLIGILIQTVICVIIYFVFFNSILYLI